MSPKKEIAPLNFLLTCSDSALSNYELTRLDAVANLRTELDAILDKLIDEMSQAGLAAWFRNQDRASLKSALENPESAVEWAKREIRRRQRSHEEMDADDLLAMPNPSTFRPVRPGLPPEKAHMSKSERYAARNIAAGKCAACPQPLDCNSVRFCTAHLKIDRERRKRLRAQKAGKRTANTANEEREKRRKATSEDRQPTTNMFRPALPLGKAHLATALRYQERQIEKGLCSECTQPLDPKSVRYCTDHLAAARIRMAAKRKKLGKTEANEQRQGGKSQRKNKALLKMLRGEEVSEE